MNDQETVVMSDLDHFVRALVGWHNTQVASLEKLMDIPSGSEVQVMDGNFVTLQDDLLKGFAIGIYTSLAMLGELPFKAEMEEGNAASTPTVH